jgi:hypothetical protein
MRVLREGLGGLYGRPLVEQEYAYRRSLQQDFLTRTQSSLYPASIVALLTQEKQGGWCLDVGPQPTRTLKTDYGWGGLWIDTHKTAMDPLEEGCVPAEHVRTDVVSCLRHYSAPPHIDFLNLELGGDTDTMQGLSNLFSSHTFGIIRCRHDRDDGMVYTSRNLILSQPSPYILLFRDVSGREDWFANPLLLPIAQTILEHPDNADPLPWEGCIRVILSLLKK